MKKIGNVEATVVTLIATTIGIIGGVKVGKTIRNVGIASYLAVKHPEAFEDDDDDDNDIKND